MIVQVACGTIEIEDELTHLGSMVRDWGCNRILIVADRAAYEQPGTRAAMEPLVSLRRTEMLTDFSRNTGEADVLKAIAAREQARPDTVIALGGGTVMDIAKLACVCTARENPASAVLRGTAPPQARSVRFIAIPTTAGSGSEATHFAAVYCDGVKYSVAHPSLLPDVAWLDERLTHSLPPAVTAATGLDAFCQAMESLWSVASTEESRGWAAEALALAWRHLPVAVHRPNAAARAAMMRAAHLAGKSINASKTTACHAMSYALTSRYEVPHGAAVALTLAPVFRRVADVDGASCLHPLGAAHVRRAAAQIADTLGASSPAEAAGLIRPFIRSLGCPTTLREVRVQTADEIRALAAEVNAERLGNFPVRIGRRDVEAILQEAY